MNNRKKSAFIFGFLIANYVCAESPILAQSPETSAGVGLGRGLTHRSPVRDRSGPPSTACPARSGRIAGKKSSGGYGRSNSGSSARGNPMSGANSPGNANQGGAMDTIGAANQPGMAGGINRNAAGGAPGIGSTGGPAAGEPR